MIARRPTMCHTALMRPPVLTDDCLAEIDARSDLDAIERPPTDALSYGRGHVDSLLECQLMPEARARAAYQEMVPRTWDEWVRLP